MDPTVQAVFGGRELTHLVERNQAKCGVKTQILEISRNPRKWLLFSGPTTAAESNFGPKMSRRDFRLFEMKNQISNTFHCKSKIIRFLELIFAFSFSAGLISIATRSFRMTLLPEFRVFRIILADLKPTFAAKMVLWGNIFLFRQISPVFKRKL